MGASRCDPSWRWVAESTAGLERVLAREAPRVRAGLIGRFRDFDLADDVLQEALLKAWQRWPQDGVPDRPAAWLYTVACRIALDTFKHHAVRRRVEPELVTALAERDAAEVEDTHLVARFDDELLRLMFTCCHPALALDAQVALTLRTLMDLSVEEIARAFLVEPGAMEQRLTRAKRKIRHAGIPWEVPNDHEIGPRLQGVLTVLYLVFNEGYAPTAGATIVNRALCREAIRTTRSLLRMLRGHAEAVALLALMLLQDSHADARRDAEGGLVLLEDQDRSLWDKRAILEGRALLEKALTLRQAPGPFQIQAAVAALHAEAADLVSTDWPQIVALYEHLVRLTDSDVVRVNRAVAIGLAQSPNEGLQALANLDGEEMRRYAPYHAAEAGLLYRAGRRQEALQSYRHALAHVQSGVVQRFFERRIAELERSTS